jgi:hypothetical protein
MPLSTDAVLIFSGVFVVVVLAGWWIRSRRKPRRRLPCQTDVDDFAKIFRF